MDRWHTDEPTADAGRTSWLDEKFQTNLCHHECLCSAESFMAVNRLKGESVFLAVQICVMMTRVCKVQLIWFIQCKKGYSLF